MKMKNNFTNLNKPLVTTQILVCWLSRTVFCTYPYATVFILPLFLPIQLTNGKEKLSGFSTVIQYWIKFSASVCVGLHWNSCFIVDRRHCVFSLWQYNFQIFYNVLIKVIKFWAHYGSQHTTKSISGMLKTVLCQLCNFI